MAQKPESLFRKRVVKCLKDLPKTHIFSIQQSSLVGTPDLLLCVNGKFVALELKSFTTEAKGLQKYNLEKVEECGGIGITAYPENWSAVFDRLKSL
jgi:hypothetical protein